MIRRFLIVIAAVLIFAGTLPVHGQSLFDDFEDEDFFESDDLFSEEGGDQFGIDLTDDELTEGGEFIDESLLGPGVGLTEAERRAQLRLTGERDLLPLNAAWGAGTGLLIGGWLAFLTNGTSRETQRSIGVGVVIGALIGVAVGTRSIFTPGSAAPPLASVREPSRDDVSLAPLVALGPTAPPLSVQFSFRF